MTTNLYCLVDGQTTSNAFPVKIKSTETIGDLKDLIKVNAPRFDNVVADELILWKVSIPVIPVTDNREEPLVLLRDLSDKKRLHPADFLSEIFDRDLPINTIHILVCHSPQGNAQTC
jgi:hypothetical protein